MLLKDKRCLCDLVTTAGIKVVCIQARAARRDADLLNGSFPAPGFGTLAEPAANSLPSQTIFHHQAADQGKRRRLQAALDRHFDPADDFIAEASDEGCMLLIGASVRDPVDNLLRKTLVAKLRDEKVDRRGVVRLYLAHRQLIFIADLIHTDSAETIFA